jgi:PAS domain S-box-containing protein
MEVAARLQGAASAEQGLRTVLPTFGEHLDWDMAVIWALAPDGDMLLCADVWFVDQRMTAFADVSRELIRRFGEGIPGECWALGDVVIVEDLAGRTDFPRRAEAIAAGLAYCIAIPLASAGRVLGVIELFATAPRVADDELVGTLRGIGRQLGQFLERLRARDALLRSEARYRTLVEATALDVWHTDPTGALTSDMPRWREFTGQTLADILGEGWATAVHPEDRDRTLAAWHDAAASRSAYEAEFRIVTADGGTRRLVARAIPLVEGGALVEWVGTTLDVTGLRRIEQEREMARADAEAARARLELLVAASGALARELDLGQVLAVLTDLAVRAMGDWCCVHLVEDDGSVRLYATKHPDPESEALVNRLLDWFPVTAQQTMGPAAVIVTGQPQLIGEMTEKRLREVTGSADEAAELSAVRPRGGIAVPLAARGRVLGALSIARLTDEGFDDADLDLLRELGRRAALAIDNAMLYLRERSVALALQRSLLPQREPDVDALDVAWRYVPGAGDTEVGGDWFDVIPLSVGRVGLVIGDVMGRGVRAAAVMGQLRAAVRAYAVQDLPPAQVMGYLDGLVEHVGDVQLVTCVYAVYDPSSYELTLSNAGHVPPMIVRSDGTPEVLPPAESVPLGVGGTGYSDDTYRLGPDDALVLYTDGLIERRDQPIDAGFAALASVVAPLSRDLNDACDTVLHGLGRATGHDDDIALLIARARRLDESSAKTIALDIAPGADSVAAARRFAEAALAPWLDAAVHETAVLLVSELVTNALRHAGRGVELRLHRGSRCVYVQVEDGDPRLPRLREPDLVEEGGRGLHLVDSLATRWGARITRRGKVVWFEMPAVPL